MSAPLAPWFQRQQMMGGYDPSLGMDEVGGPGMWASRKLIQLRRHRCGDDGGDLVGYYGDDVGGDDDDDLGGIDQEIGAANWSDDDDDEIGANPSRAMKKAKKKLKRAEKNLEEVELKIARTRIPRRKEKLKEKRADIKAQIKELKAAINRAGKSGGRDDGDGDDGDESTTTNGQRRSMRYNPYGGDGTGVYAAPPPGGRQMEVPLLFNGSNIFQATIAGGTAPNITAAFTADSQAFNYLVLRVRGFKINAWLNAGLVQSGGSPIAIVDQTNQLAVECQSLVPDGGLDLIANARQTINLGGSFGAASEKEFDGLRSLDDLEQNGTARLTGQIRTLFQTVGTMQFAMQAALLCDVVQDFKVDRYTRGR